MNPLKISIPDDLDWELLKRFNTCVHSDSFAEAAKKIGTSQAGLNRQLDTLEHKLGKKLFERTAKYRSTELTPEGKLLKSITDQVFEIVKKQIIKNIITPHDNNKKKQNIKIITTPGLSTTLLPEAIARFLNSQPDTQIELSVQLFPRRILVGEVMIRQDFLHQENLKTSHLATLNTNFYASNEYLERFGLPSSYDDLINHHVLAFKYFNVSSTDMYALSHDRVFYLEPVIQSDYIGFLVEMACKNLGIIELPDIHPATKTLMQIASIPTQTADIFAGFMDLADQPQIIYNFIEFLLNFTKKGNKS